MIADELREQRTKVGIVGLGYVGLPLAVAFGKKVPTVGFDVKTGRIEDLKRGIDETHEATVEDLKAASRLEFTSDPVALKDCAVIIVAVPTPITRHKRPDLTAIRRASQTVGTVLRKDSIVVYESTVYPGVTEEVCVPILEEYSGLRCGEGFRVGYSPERINPGDREHTVTQILKIVSGQDSATLEEVATVYELVIEAGVYRAESIKTAEAAKVIENVQRDLNIALINELSMIFHRLGVDTHAVLEAAGTKWNFIKMKPGLVGGHCIGVDPYYLTYKAEEIGYHPQVILAGRRINDGMGKYVAEQTIKQMIRAEKVINRSRVLVAGLTFKENVGDIRNSRVIDVIRELEDYGMNVTVIDPLANPEEVRLEYDLELAAYDPGAVYDAIILAVPHETFRDSLNPEALKAHLGGGEAAGVLIDVKGLYSRDAFPASSVLYWRL